MASSAGRSRRSRARGPARSNMPHPLQHPSVEKLLATLADAVAERLLMHQPSQPPTTPGMREPSDGVPRFISSPPLSHPLSYPSREAMYGPPPPSFHSSDAPSQAGSFAAHMRLLQTSSSSAAGVSGSMYHVPLTPSAATPCRPDVRSPYSPMSRVQRSPAHGPSLGDSAFGLPAGVMTVNSADERSSRGAGATMARLVNPTSYGPDRSHSRRRQDAAHGLGPLRTADDASSTDNHSGSDWSRPSSSSSSSSVERLRRNVATTQFGMRTLRQQTTNPRQTKMLWSTRAAMDPLAWQSLAVPPFPISDLYSADTHFDADPTLEQLQRGPGAVNMNHFTHALWLRHFSSKQQYGVKSVLPDSFYVNAVKELYQPGHLMRSTLSTDCPALAKALKTKSARDARFMLFDPPASATGGSQPLLAMVTKQNLALMSPSYSDCVRVVPISQVFDVLSYLHKHLGHKVTAITHHVLEHYSGIPREVCKSFQHYCLQCVEAVALDRKKVPVKPIVQHRVRYRYIADLVHMQPVKANDDLTYKYILVMVDHFSRYRWAKALVDKTAAGVVRALTQWWQLQGRPQVFQSDNGLEFAAEEVVELCRAWGVQKRHSRPYHPATNGAVERANRDVKDSIVKLQRDHPKDTWVELLDMAVHNHNCAWTRVHKDRPHNVFHSAELPMTATAPLPPGSIPAANDWHSDSDSDGGDPQHVPGVGESDAEASGGSEGEPPQDEAMTDVAVEDEETEDAVGSLHRPAGERQECVSPEGRDAAAAGSVPVCEWGLCDGGGGGQREASDAGLAAQHVGPGSVFPSQDAYGQGKDEARTSSPQPPFSAPSSGSAGAITSAAGHGAVERDADGMSFDREELEREGVAVKSSPNHPEFGPPPDTSQDVVIPKSVSHCTSLGTMRFPQWTRFSMRLYTDMRRAYVSGLGDCAAIAPYAAHHQHHSKRYVMTEAEIRSERDAAQAWLAIEANSVRFEAEPTIPWDLAGLRECLKTMRVWLPPEMLWIYACRFTLNVYLCQVSASNDVREKIKHSNFDVRLITPERPRGAVQLIKSNRGQPNTIAIYFHHISNYYGNESEEEKTARLDRDRHGFTGHFEYLVDKTGKSCWETTDEVVQKILQPALLQAERIRHLNFYTEAMEKHANAALARSLPDIAEGDLAMWMVPDYFRGKSKYVRQLDGDVRNMPVRVLNVVRHLPTRQRKNIVARFTVLSYSGVVEEWLDHAELRAVGQDVPELTELKQRLVTEDMYAKRVPLMTAWEEYLERHRNRAAEGRQQHLAALRRRRAESHAVLDSTVTDVNGGVDDPGPAAAAASVDEGVAAAAAAAETMLSPLQTRTQRQTAAAVNAGLEAVKCCVCWQDVLPVGSHITCAGTCQQSMHSAASPCADKYVPVGSGLYCCSKPCTRPFLQE
jgi:hypothetical protein